MVKARQEEFFRRIVIGFLVDYFGPKRVGALAQVVVILSLLAAWAHGLSSYPQVLALGVALGVAGASCPRSIQIAATTTRWCAACPGERPRESAPNKCWIANGW